MIILCKILLCQSLTHITYQDSFMLLYISVVNISICTCIQTYLSQIYVDAIIDGAMLLTKYSFFKDFIFWEIDIPLFFCLITFWRHYLYNEQRI